MAPHSSPLGGFARATLRLSTVLLAIIIVTTIENVEGKGFGSMGSVKSSGRMGGSGPVSMSGGFRNSRWSSVRGLGGYHGGGVMRTRWWILAAVGTGNRGHQYRNRDLVGQNETSSNSTVEYMEEPSRSDVFAGVSGLFYIAFYFICALVKGSIKTGRYDLTEYTVMYFLSFLCFTAFTAIAYNIPISKVEGGGDSWESWFDSNSTLVQSGESPLNYFDTVFCLMGMLLSVVLICKDLSFATEAAPFPLNMMTMLSMFGVAVVFVISGYIGLTGSWRVPLILLSCSTIALTLFRYLGLLYSHQAGLPVGTKRKRKFYWHDGSELISGFFSLLFHVLMASTYEEGSVLIVNSAAIAIAALALAFDSFFLIQLHFGLCCRRKDRYIPSDVGYEAKLEQLKYP